VARPPASQQAAVPAWVRSPDARSGERRRLIWGIVGSVLGTSIVVGGLAGFFVGSRGKPWSAILGMGRPPTQSKSQPAGLQSSSEHEVTAVARAPAASGNPAKSPTPSSAGLAPAVAKTAPAARTSGSDKALATAGAARGLPARGSVAATSLPSAQELAQPGPRKEVTNAEDGTPGTWGQGVPDTGAGLVTVSVSSQPAGASVWINGKERGRTPLRVKIQAGRAQVVMVLAGHASATADLTASEGMAVSKELAAIDPPMTGEARFRAECVTLGKLPIVVDGKETGVLCPFSKLRVDPGLHRIGLFVPALGKVHEKEVTLHPGVRSIVFAD
jgi:hypothetical protein